MEENNIKYELIGDGSPIYLSTFSNLLIVAVHYTYKHHMLCIVAVVDCTHVHHVVLNKITEQSISFYYCRLSPYGPAAASDNDLLTLQRRTL